MDGCNTKLNLYILRWCHLIALSSSSSDCCCCCSIHCEWGWLPRCCDRNFTVDVDVTWRSDGGRRKSEDIYEGTITLIGHNTSDSCCCCGCPNKSLITVQCSGRFVCVLRLLDESIPRSILIFIIAVPHRQVVEFITTTSQTRDDVTGYYFPSECVIERWRMIQTI